MSKVQQNRLRLLLFLLSAISITSNNVDQFNYGETKRNGGRFDYGPEEWDKVSCDDPNRCSGFPDSWETGIGWDLEGRDNNKCEWCPAVGDKDCGQHRQSPIDLNRDRGLWNHPNNKECPDWHWMKYEDGSCTWEDMIDNDESIYRNNFLIRRHALQILQPMDGNNNLRCFKESLSGSRYPRVDYSKGFPDWWHLAHTEISVPSEHTQEGKRYDAEVTLAHFYETDHYKNQLGKIVIFMQAYDFAEPWPFLDKMICQWRETEEQQRKNCGLDSAATYYPGCTNYDRGHTPAPVAPPTPSPAPTKAPPTFKPTKNPTDAPTKVSTKAPTGAPTPVPTKDPTKLPTERPTEAPTREPTNLPTKPPTFSPVTVINEIFVETLSPTTSSPISVNEVIGGFFFNRCHICGDPDFSVTNKEAILDIPAFPKLSCAEFENAGTIGMIDPMICPNFPSYVGPCECKSTKTLAPVTERPTTQAPTLAPTTLVPTTPAPVTLAPTTTAPVTPAPITPAPVTPAPITSSPVTPVPTTLAPVTPAPVSPPTLAPVLIIRTRSPVTPLPTTLAPITFAPTTSSPVSPSPSTLSPTRKSITASPVTFAPEPSSTGSGSQPTIQPVIPADIIPPGFDIAMPWLDIYKGDLKPSISPSTSPSVSLSVTSPDTTTGSPSSIPPIITCPSFAMGMQIDFNYNRMCKSGGCCDTDKRSATDFCHDLYSFFGEDMDSACWHCCDEPKIVPQSPAKHPVFPPLNCANIDNPNRICHGTESCCESERQTSEYCQDIYKDYGDSIHTICWYCCETSLEVGTDPDADKSDLVRRLLRIDSYRPVRNPLNLTVAMDPKKKLSSVEKLVEPNYQLVNSALKKEDALLDREETIAVIQKHDMLRNDEEMTSVLDETGGKNNTEEDTDGPIEETLTDDEYFDTLMERHLKNENVIRDVDERRHRRLINYDDVEYFPYEWLVKVNTEYYFRYEGTQAVPPCKDQVHWRIMKDPIPIAPHQLAELQRLLAERISPKDSKTKECELDNAGAVRPDTDEKLFDFARPTQKFHKLHRKVFCECKDWKSKFPADRAWCKRNVIDRFYRNPYGFNPGFEFF